ncbi:MAG: hypothetical protein A2679_02055 [Candidatus Sungbacteria bacterium RIFCSPHIGHO2_01_FULL_54_26]|uniref:Alanyl-transfer RNA synthetases family profile domain-containing protein n=1 Tax=Candidatus Sungbacteria bacterium RIFCSPHIGHO2_02_FULL_53_17 TaxID=1802275 RepID=A0A1G2KVQ5_9BACT|nr:MAG: hypothetical protein A2679_02055 [Candidatus Sungbacteria bacterium RIFCSPHIGHO2_01_FULL_54_26]OHA03518.1 MAG: hypothetical protein A3C92_03510 [Candidatus Sungbacteria bacterium RIFCSPHIGHO2_02_FULL_53_17]
METTLLYLEDFSRLTCEATVQSIARENEKGVVALDATVFYPQGGGQPYDTGMIESPAGKFLVEEVRWTDGIVRHIGHFEHGAFAAGENVSCRVDAQRRMLHSRIHSAGHLVDFAVAQLALGWTPGKGYHFPQGPYVEYGGMLGDADREKLKQDIERIGSEIIRQGKEVSVRFMSKEDMRALCRFVPENIPDNKPGRVVVFGNTFGVPCGGTHVTNLSEIRGFSIRKIKQESPNIRVGYDIAGS